MFSKKTLRNSFQIILLLCVLAHAQEWEPFNGHEYHFEKVNFKSWRTAREWCMNNGGDLTSILDEEESTFIQSKVEHRLLWIGLNTLADRETWSWSDSQALSYQDWKENFPEVPDDNNIHKLCVEVEFNEAPGSWRNLHCENLRGSICKRKEGNTAPVTDRPTPILGGYCPTGYFNFDVNDNKCYRIVAVHHETDGQSHDEARAECLAGPGHLPDIVSIHSQYENAILTSQLQKVAQSFHIGLTHADWANRWRWDDNTDLEYEYWAKGEPSDVSSKKCGELRFMEPPGVWGTVSCDRRQSYICQTFKSEFNTKPHFTTPYPCPPGYKSYWYACYMITDTTFNWDNARTHCEGSYPGAELASIHSTPENAALYAELTKNNAQAWIGLNDRDNTGSYEWTDGWTVLHTAWGPNEPSRNMTGGCVSMHSDGKWYDDPCTEHREAICKYTTEPQITPPPAPRGVCPGEVEGFDKWKKYHQHCYYFETSEQLTWTAAGVRCMELGGPNARLASIHDLQENHFLQDNLEDAPASVWIGLYQHKSGGTYHWSDGSVLQYERWSAGEPSSRDEQCVEMLTYSSGSLLEGFWNDKLCPHTNGFVCKTEQVDTPDIPEPVNCPENWHGTNDHCYYFEALAYTTWDLAQEKCKDLSDGKANLASIHSLLESMWIQTEYESKNQLPEPYSYWTGLHKTGPLIAGHEFQWIDDDELSFYNWDTDQPSENDGSQNCVEAHVQTAKWKNIHCSQYRGYVCKMARSSGKGLSGGQIAGIVIGVLLAVALIVAVLIFLGGRFGYIKKPRFREPKFENFQSSSSAPSTPVSTRKEHGNKTSEDTSA